MVNSVTPSSTNASAVLASVHAMARSIAVSSRPASVASRLRSSFLRRKASMGSKLCQMWACRAAAGMVRRSPPPPMRMGIGRSGGRQMLKPILDALQALIELVHPRSHGAIFVAVGDEVLRIPTGAQTRINRPPLM